MTIELRQQLKQIIGARGGTWIDLPSLLPANTLLEMAGESLRPRLYFTTTPNGQELCLRADLTIAAALYFLQNTVQGEPLTILCEGKVFRAPLIDGAAAEFTQIGIENYGSSDTIQSDAQIFICAFEACKSAGLKSSSVSFADGCLIECILNSPKIPLSWAQFLRTRAKSKTALLKGVHDAVSHKSQALSKIEKQILELDENAACALILDKISERHLQIGPARSALEIANRIKAKSQRIASAPLDSEIEKLLLNILAIKGAPRYAINEIVQIGNKLGVDLSRWAKEWEARLGKFETEFGNDFAQISFCAMPDARFEYYDGMIFEIAARGSEDMAIAFGGRYDGLVRALSNGMRNAPAVGAVIRPERLLGALHG